MKDIAVKLAVINKRAYRYQSPEDRHLQKCRETQQRNLRLLAQQEEYRKNQIANIMSGKLPCGGRALFGPQPKKRKYILYETPTINDLTPLQQEQLAQLPLAIQEKVLHNILSVIIFKRNNGL